MNEGYEKVRDLLSILFLGMVVFTMGLFIGHTISQTYYTHWIYVLLGMFNIVVLLLVMVVFLKKKSEREQEENGE